MRFFTFRVCVLVCEFVHIRTEIVGTGIVCPCQAAMIKYLCYKIFACLIL